MKRSLRGRLARTLGITAALSVAVTALISFGLVRRFADQDALRQLDRHADAVAREADAFELGQAPALRRLLGASGDQVALVGPRGRMTGEDADARAVAAQIDLQPVLGGQRVTGRARIASGSFVYVALPVSGQRGNTAAVVLVRPVGLARDVWGPIFVRLLIAGALAVLVAVGVSSVVARRIADPLHRVAEATARVASGDLAQRVPVDGDDEVAEVARRFNVMADSLSEARRREHEFLASVSHELRTPITAIRGYAEAIGEGAVTEGNGLQEAVGVIHDESARLERLVQDVMDLARLGAKDFRLEPVRVDLAATLVEAVKAHQAHASEAGVALVADAPEQMNVTTDPGRVRQIVSNLVENALRVTPGGGTVRVSGRAAADGVTIEVSDSGPGIAAEDLPHVFERSYLWSRSKGVRNVGSGLGLAIVRELSTALGGTLTVSSEPGKGATFRLLLPTH
jgi:two-component system OmpR family sensor kinase